MNPRAVADAHAAGADVVVFTGGVSAGAYEPVKNTLGAWMEFARVAMQPGKPQGFGVSEHGILLFGLPGNPVSAAVSFEVFVRPALLRMMGCNDAASAPPPLLRARSTMAIRKKPGRTEYQRGFVQQVPGQMPQVSIAGNQGSGVLSSMVQANGLIVMHHGQGNVAVGDAVDVMVFDGVI